MDDIINLFISLFGSFLSAAAIDSMAKAYVKKRISEDFYELNGQMKPAFKKIFTTSVTPWRNMFYSLRRELSSKKFYDDLFIIMKELGIIKRKNEEYSRFAPLSETSSFTNSEDVNDIVINFVNADLIVQLSDVEQRLRMFNITDSNNAINIRSGITEKGCLHLFEQVIGNKSRQKYLLMLPQENKYNHIIIYNLYGNVKIDDNINAFKLNVTTLKGNITSRSINDSTRLLSYGGNIKVNIPKSMDDHDIDAISYLSRTINEISNDNNTLDARVKSLKAHSIEGNVNILMDNKYL